MKEQKKTSEPLVSVIIPTCNRSAALVRALSSLAKQTYKNIEAVVIDDASIDDTEPAVRLFEKQFEKQLKISYFRNTRNRGAAYNRNVGLKNAQGEYFALLDDDDEFMDKKIEIQLKAAQSFDQKMFILSNGNNLGAKTYAYDLQKPGGFITWKKGFFPIKCNLTPPSSWFFHRELVDTVGYFDEEMKRWEDIDYCLRLMVKFPVYMVNQLLVNWYPSPNSLTGMSPIEIEVRRYFLKKHFDLIRQDSDYLYRFYWRLGKDLKETGKKADAIEFFRKAYFVKPYRFEPLAKLVELFLAKRAV